MSNLLYGAIEAAIPDRQKALIELSDGARISYGEVFDLAGKLAGHLIRRGVVPGDRVAVQVEKSWQNLALYLACLRAAAVYLPLNTAYPLAELEYFLGDAQPAFVVVAPQNEDGVCKLCARIGKATVESLGANGEGSLLKAAADAKPAPAVSRGPDDLAAILYTSGTTGRSKGAMLTHDNLLSNARVLVDYWRFTERDVLLHALPIFHTHGLFVACNVLLLSGGSTIFLPKFDADEVIRLLPKATSMMAVPTFYVRLLDEPGFTRDLTRHMRLFTSGSAPLLPETHHTFRERTGHAILERYGMTETNMNTSNPYDGDRIPGTVGFPLPGVEVRVADPEAGRALARGEIGVNRGARAERLHGLLANAGKDQGRISGGLLLHHRRHRQDRRARLRAYRRTRQGSRDHRRLQRLSEGGRDRTRCDRGRDRIGGDWPAASRFRRGRHRRLGVRKRGKSRRGRRYRRAEGEAREVQAAEARVFRRRIAEKRHGQGAEERVARNLCTDLRARCRVKRE
jgi:acyl-coenzyme A synthetase/AMP-(fatty) acid ligase